MLGTVTIVEIQADEVQHPCHPSSDEINVMPAEILFRGSTVSERGFNHSNQDFICRIRSISSLIFSN